MVCDIGLVNLLDWFEACARKYDRKSQVKREIVLSLALRKSFVYNQPCAES